jgi:hypothetical protein
MSRFLSILASLTLIWVTIPVVADDPGSTTDSGLRPKDGDYNITIAGYIRNNGNSSASTVAGDKVNLQASVVSNSTGETGQLLANLTLVDTHFKGTGAVLGQSATFNGRLDFPDSEKERAIRGVRLVCTLKTTDGKYARIIGYVPALAAVRDRIDVEDRDRNRGKPPHKD